MNRITVITATFNSSKTLPKLADSLKEQDDKNFLWLVIDGGSTDGTVDFLSTFKKENDWMDFVSESDRGIYDALNKAILSCKTDFYLVVGSDDFLFSNSIKDFNSSLTSVSESVGIVLAKIKKGNRIFGGFYPRLHWLGHSFVFRGSHSVGMLIKKSLHDEFGLYSLDFSILSDGFFLKRVLSSSVVEIVERDFVSGFFSEDGVSNTRDLFTIAEGWQIQMLTEKHKRLQIFIFIFKILFKFRSLVYIK